MASPTGDENGDDFRSKLLPLIREALAEIVEKELVPAVKQLEAKIPSEEKIAAIAHSQMKAVLADATEQANAIRAQQGEDLEDVREAGTTAKDEPRQTVRKKGVDKILGILHHPGVAEKITHRFLDRLLGPDVSQNPFAVLHQIHEENPDVAEFYGAKWAPDPLSGQLDVLLAQQGVKAFETGQKGMYQALLKSGWRPPTTLTDPPSSSSSGTTDEPAEPKPEPGESSGSGSGDVASLIATSRR